MSYIPLRVIKEILDSIDTSLRGLRIFESMRGTKADLRTTMTGGTLDSVSLVNQVGTVGSLSNQTDLGSYKANPLVPSQQNVNAVLSNISNIKIS